MSLTTECGWAAARAGGIATFALLAGLWIRALIVSSTRRMRFLAWFLLVVPYLVPAILVGYAYSSFSLSLVRHPAWNLAFYNMLVWMKLVPVATLVLYLAPAFVSREALHCHRLLGGGAVRSFAFQLRGSGRAWAVGFAVVFLFAFGEFEMASLLVVNSWTVSLFDAHAGGLALSESSRLAVVPVVCEGIVLLAVMVILLRGRPAARVHRRTCLPGAARWLAWAYLAAAVVAMGAIPGFIVLRGTIEGLRELAQSFKLAKDVAASLLFASAAAGCAWLAAGWFAGHALHRGAGKARILCAFLLSVPGLLGPLLLSLFVLALFQRPALRAAYDTPLPLMIALTLLAFPFALLLRVLIQMFRPGPGLHAARLLRASPVSSVRRAAQGIVWHLKGRAQFWVVFLLFCWGYFDLTASHILHPTAMTPVFVWLYNFMHYGRSAVLSAMVCVAFLAPVLLLLAARAGRGVHSRLCAHG